jgi:hypothetical protein
LGRLHRCPSGFLLGLRAPLDKANGTEVGLGWEALVRRPLLRWCREAPMASQPSGMVGMENNLAGSCPLEPGFGE